MATPLETVKKQMIKLKYPYFTVKYNAVTINRQTEAIPPDEAAEELEQFLEGCTYNHVDVTISKRSFEDKSKGGGNVDYTHRISLKGAIASPLQRDSTAGNSSMVITLLREMQELKLEFQQKMFEAKMEALEKKFEEKGKEKENPLQDAALTMLINMFSQNGTGIAAPTSTVVNGTQADEQPKNINSDKERLKAAINKLSKADPDFITTLELVAEFAATKPSQYNSFKPLVKSQL